MSPPQPQTAQEQGQKLEETGKTSSNKELTLKFNEQAALIWCTPEILKLYKDTFPKDATFGENFKGRNGVPYKRFVTVRRLFKADGTQAEPAQSDNLDEDSRFLITKLFFRDEKYQSFFGSMNSLVRDTITPEYTFYKTYFIGDKPSELREIDFKIPFKNTTPDNYSYQQNKILTDNEYDRFITKNNWSTKESEYNPDYYKIDLLGFEYEFAGVNTADTDTSINAQIKIRFANPLLFGSWIDPRGFPDHILQRDLADQISGKRFWYTDLLSTSNEDVARNKKTDFKIKLIYNLTSNISDELYKENPVSGFSNASLFREYLGRLSVSLVLMPQKHDIKINHDGSVDVTIDYVGSIDTFLHSNATNVFNGLKTNEPGFEQSDLAALERELEAKKRSLSEGTPPDEKTATDSQRQQIEELNNQIKFLERKIDRHKDAYYRFLFDALIGKVSSGTDGTSINSGIYKLVLPKQNLGISEDYGIRDNIASTPTGGSAAAQKAQNEMGGAVTAEQNAPKKIKKFERVSLIQLKESEQAKKGSEPSVVERLGQAVSDAGQAISAAASGVAGNQEAVNDYNDANRVLEKTEAKDAPNTANSSAEGDDYELYFVFLGDVLEILLSCLDDLPPLSKPRIILDNLFLTFPDLSSVTSPTSLDRLGAGNVTKINLNIADIPISVSLLKHFWTNLTKDRPSVLTISTVLISLIDDLLKPAISPTHYGKLTHYSNNIKLGTVTVDLPMGDGNRDVIFDATYKEQGSAATSTSPEVAPTSALPATSGKFYGILTEGKLESVSNGIKNNMRSLMLKNGSLSYLIIYDASFRHFKREKPNAIIDNKKGIYHLTLYSAESIVKDINFTRSETEGLREAMAEKMTSNNNSYNAFAKQAYNCEIKMDPGLPLFKSGDTIFVDPFKNLGLSDAGKKLGFSGYYKVLKAKYSFGSQETKTGIHSTISCIQSEWSPE